MSNWLDDLPAVVGRVVSVLDHPAVVVGVATSVVMAVGMLAWRRHAARPATGRTAADKLMTFFGAVVATGVVGTGMWSFFGDVLHIQNPVMRAALFAFFEIAMLASALRSRRFRLDRAAGSHDEQGRREIDVDGIAVWVLALLSGVFAASDQQTKAGAALRLVAPLVAAWLWERGLAGELRQFTRARRTRINLRVSLERVLVFLRIAEPTGREVADVDRDRQIARMARNAYWLNTLPAGATLRRRLATRIYLRRVGRANERLGLATNPELRRQFQMNLATLYQAVEGTSPTAVAKLTPWSAVVDQSISRPRPTASPPAAAPDAPTDRRPQARPINGSTAKPTRLVRLVHGPTAIADAAFLRERYGDDQSADHFPGRNEILRRHNGNAGRWSAALKAHADRADRSAAVPDQSEPTEPDREDSLVRHLVGASA